jgi:hypothetical protein
MSDQTENDNGARFIARELDTRLRWSRHGQLMWSFANHGSTVCIIVFSATAAVLAQANAELILLGHHPKAWATALSLAVTIISAVQAKLGFERKWVANRMTNSALNQLLIDEKTGADLQDLKEKLKTIVGQHDKLITATGSPPP